MARLNSNDHSLVVLVPAYALIVLSAVFVGVRVLARWRHGKAAEVTCHLIHTSLLLAIGQTYCVRKMVNNGLGRHTDAVDVDEYGRLEKVPLHPHGVFVADCFSQNTLPTSCMYSSLVRRKPPWHFSFMVWSRSGSSCLGALSFWRSLEHGVWLLLLLLRSNANSLTHGTTLLELV